MFYNGGVVIGTDTLCSYGSMADFKYEYKYKFRNAERIA